MRGSLFMMVAMAGFTANDALTKLAGLHVSPAQIMLVRGVFATTIVGLLAWQQNAWRPLRTLLVPAVGVRVTAELIATFAFLIGLMQLPLANATALMQALPLAITMGAALFLHEPVGWRRWSAVAVGFLGVMIIVRPGFEGFNSFALYTLFSVLACTVRDLSTSRVPKSIPTLYVALATSVAVTLGGLLALVPFGGWTPMEAPTLGILGLASMMVVVGYQFAAMAVRTGEMSAVAPFRYTALLWSILLTIVLFGQYPDTPMIVGAVIIVASGIYAFWRERQVDKTRPAAATSGPTMAPDGL
jgi:drug/metabolite transporter (DMT)-like permease